jgi:hypothetical protein
MKNKLSIFAAIAIALLLTSTVGTAFAWIPVSAPHAAVPTAIEWIEDELGNTGYTGPTQWTTSTVSVGYNFTIQVALNITTTTKVFSLQTRLAWPSFLNLTYYDGELCNAYPSLTPHEATPPAQRSEFFIGHSTTASVCVYYSTVVTPDTILASDALSGTDFAFGHAAALFNATFTVIAAPSIGHTLSGALVISVYNGTDVYWATPPPVSFNPFDGGAWDFPITYVWAAPSTKPYMGISGAGLAPSSPLVFGPYPPSAVGMTFVATVSVDNLDPAWYLGNASFTLTWNSTVIDVLGGIPSANFTLASGWSVITNTCTQGTGVWTFVANYTGGGSGTVPVGTLTFTVLLQEKSPPWPATWIDQTYLTFSGVVFNDVTIPIPAGTSQQGFVQVKALLTLPLPCLQVSPTTLIVGPSPSIGSMITVNVNVVNLTSYWYTVCIQFRLAFDKTVLQFDTVTEGPFFTNPIWDLYGTYFFNIYLPVGDLVYPTPDNPIISGPYLPEVQVMDFLYPNAHGVYDQAVLPNTLENVTVNPTIATFTFTILQQNCFGGVNITTPIEIYPMWPPADECFIDKNANYIPSNPALNGTVIIEPINEIDRGIDLFGGAVNDGYGHIVDWTPSYPSVDPLGGSYPAFPAPYGGQGPNAPMDIAFPQTQVYLNAYVWYNYWPIQSKDVGFEVEGPFYHVTTADNGGLLYNATGYLLVNATVTSQYVPEVGQTYYDAVGNVVLTLPNSYEVWAKFTATTDTHGVASYTYRMPWPCTDPDSITGVWRITATVTVADQVVSDTMMFYYQRLVYITSVSTDSLSYDHGQYIKVTVNYETHSIQTYPALFAIVAMDNLSVPFGMALQCEQIGGAVFCTWTTGTFTQTIFIPKWAFAGDAYIYVSVYDKDPTIGGEAWAPQFSPPPMINIYPY